MVAGQEGMMELTAAEQDLFSAYLATFDSLTGDRRTRTVLGETVRGIIGAESLCCRRIAAFSPCTGDEAARRPAGAAHGPC